MILPRLAIACSALVAAVFLAAPASAQNVKPTTVIVVRHAEKEAQPANDPPLTADGQARALALWEAVKDANVTAVITTQLARTKMTAAPTAAHLAITPEVVNAGGATHVADVAAAVKRHAGETVLVVGHSNTVPAIVAALGGKEPAAICDPEYDDLFVVTVSAAGTASVIRSRYGVATPVPANCGAK